MADHHIPFTEQEVDDLIKAVDEASGELCCGDNFPEANAQWERWQKLYERLLSYQSK